MRLRRTAVPRFTLLTRRALLALGTALGLTAAGLTMPSYAAPPTTPYIAEIHYDNDGTDAGEFVEVHLPAGTTSAGLDLVLYNGNGGGTYDTKPLPLVEAPADGPAVAVVEWPSNGIQNGGPDGLALVDDGAVHEFLSYEGTITAVGGPADGRTSTDIGVSEGSSTPVGHSLSRTYDAAGDELVWHPPAPATKGAVNPAPGTEPEPEPEPEPTPLCEVTPTHEIGQVQGAGEHTPLDGQQVTVRGTVVGDVPGLSGFYLQDPDGDGNAATSDGIFVFSRVAVDLGDTVVVQGGAREYFDQTQISSREDVAVCVDGSATDLPDPAALDLPATDAEREPFEGMLVRPVDELTVSEVYDLTRFGELTLSEGGLLVQPTELARPGPEAQAIAAQNQLRRIVLDDGLGDRLDTDEAPYLSPTTPVRVGAVLDLTEPVVLGYGFNQWRLQPSDGTADGVFAPQNTRPAAPDAVGGDVQVGAFNVLNYFLTFVEPGRGARSAEQLEKQAGKIVPAILALDADILTLMEIEDTDSTGYTPGDADAALADLVRRLNEAEGADVWSYVPMPEELYGVDRDVIRNGIIYRHDIVETIGEPVGLVDESVWDNAREPIAQAFAFDGDVFTVVANHFKSKGSGDEAAGDNVDSRDGQGAWNGDRVRQAESLAAFADRLRQQAGDPDVLLMGDFNAYSQEDPMMALRDAGFTNLGTRLDPGGYSYVFDDQSGSLDHALASSALVPKVTDLAHWNINAVESFAYQYYGDPELYAPHPYRSSDHDPLLLGIDVAERCNGLVPTIVGTPGDDVIDAGAGEHVVMGLGGNDVIRGGDGEDVLCGGAGIDRLSGEIGDDVLDGGFGDDVLDGDTGDDRLVGGPGADVLRQGGGEGIEEQGGRAS